MRMITLMLLACTLPLAAQSSGPDSDSARAAAIVARHVAAVGGDSAFRAITEYRMVTTMKTPGPDPAPDARQELYVKSPNLVYIRMDIRNAGTIEMGFDGDVAWTNSADGPTIHPEVPKQLIDAANFSADPTRGARISYTGRRRVGRRTVDAVRTAFPDNQVVTHYFDVATGLLAGLDPGDAPAPPGPMSLALDDYKRFGAVLRPTKATTVIDGQRFVMRTVSVDHGPFDDKIFELPAAVRRLRDKQPAR
jgi:hypothetical protein